MMTNSIWLGVGFVGQALFSTRFIIQWFATEKLKKSTIPTAFWYFSIAGSLTLLSYALYRRDPVFVLGQTFGVLIYLRNLFFIHPNIIKKLLVVIIVYFSLLSYYLFSIGYVKPEYLITLRRNNTPQDNMWQIFGFLGQMMFSMRFILQWLASEKKKQSVVPISFWYFSLFGSISLLCYAIYQQDPVFIIGQSFGLVVYFRNLYYIFKNDE